MSTNHVQITGMLKALKLFQGLEDSHLDQVADSVTLLELAEGAPLTADEDEVRAFYIVVSGQMQVSGMKGKKLYTNPFSTGDFWYPELLLREKLNSLALTATEPTTLARMKITDVVQLMRAVPIFKANLKRNLDIFQLRRNKHFQWLRDDETILTIERKHRAYLFIALIPPLVVAWFGILLIIFATVMDPSALQRVMEWTALLALAIAALWGAWSLLDWRNDYYVVTNQRVVWLEQIILLYDSRRETPLTAVKAQEVKSTLIARLLGFGDVIVSAFMGQVVFRHIGEPARVKAVIEQAAKAAKETQLKATTGEMAQAIRRKIEPVIPAVPEPPGPETQIEIVPVRQATPFWVTLSNYFKTRVEEAGVVTYRKHIFVLLTKTWLPTLLGLAVIAGTVMLLWLKPEFPSPPVIILLGLFLLFLLMLWWLYQFIDWRNDIYQITADKIIDSERKPLGDEISKSAQLANIQSIEFERFGILGLLLNFGNVIINVGTEVKFIFMGIHDPAQAQQDIFNHMYENLRQKEKSEATKEWERTSDWFAIYEQLKKDMEKPKNPPYVDQI